MLGRYLILIDWNEEALPRRQAFVQEREEGVVVLLSKVAQTCTHGVRARLDGPSSR